MEKLEKKEKIICIIDNDFYMTLPVIRAIALYRTKVRKDILDSYNIIFYHICPVSNEDEKIEFNEKKEIYRQRFDDELKDVLSTSELISGSYCELMIELEKSRNINKESKKIVNMINKSLKDKFEDYNEDNVLFMLDLALEFKASDPKKSEDSKAWLGRGVYRIIENKRVLLFTSYYDELKMWELFKESYEKEYGVKLLVDVIPMSRSGLNPRGFNTYYGKRILEWD